MSVLTMRKFVEFAVRCPTPARRNPLTVSCDWIILCLGVFGLRFV